MNFVYPGALDSIGRAEIDLEGVDLFLLLVDGDYDASTADGFLDEVPSGARHGSAAALAGARTMTGGVLSTDTFSTDLALIPADVDDVIGLVLYVDGATDADRRLLAFYDRQADSTLITFTPDGGDAVVTFPDGRILRI